MPTYDFSAMTTTTTRGDTTLNIIHFFVLSFEYFSLVLV